MNDLSPKDLLAAQKLADALCLALCTDYNGSELFNLASKIRDALGNKFVGLSLYKQVRDEKVSHSND